VALALSAMIDTSEHFTSSMAQPAFMQSVSAAVPAPQNSARKPIAQTYMHQYKNYEEFQQAFVEYDRRVQAAVAEMKKERLQLQKLHIQDNYIGGKLKTVGAEIDSLKTLLKDMSRKK
jgi:hypothetical protein